MDFFEALPLVVGSYLVYGLIHRRVRLVLGRRRAACLRAYPIHALVAELGPVGPQVAEGPSILRAPVSTSLGWMPDGWVESGWFQASVGPLEEARELLLAGAPEEAMARSEGAPWEQVEGLFTWAALLRIWADQLEAAQEIAQALARSERAPARAAKLMAMVYTRRSERLRGEEATTAAERALAYLERVDPARLSAPAWSALGAHLGLLRLSLLTLEWDRLVARRRLEAAGRLHPTSPFVFFVRAHLATTLGDDTKAADFLAKALYHCRGDAFFARPILALPGLALSHPTLFAQARALSRATSDVDTRESGPLESEPLNRGPRA